MLFYFFPLINLKKTFCRCSSVAVAMFHGHSRLVDPTGAMLLCIELLGGGLLVGGAGGFPLPQVVAALVLLPHAVHQEEDEEDGEQEADHAACNHS